MKAEIYYQILNVITLLIIYALLVLGSKRRKTLNELRDSYRELNLDYDEEIQNFKDTKMELGVITKDLDARRKAYREVSDRNKEQQEKIKELEREVKSYETTVANQRTASNTLASENLRLQNIINDYQVHPLKYLRITTSKHHDKASIRLKFNENFNQYEAIPYGYVDTVQEVKLIEHVKEKEKVIFVPNNEEPAIFRDFTDSSLKVSEENSKEEAPE